MAYFIIKSILSLTMFFLAFFIYLWIKFDSKKNKREKEEKLKEREEELSKNWYDF